MSRECMESVRQFKVDKGSAALWWLGQMGYLIKTPEGTVLSVDAYLTNSCKKFGDSVGLHGSQGSGVHRARGTGC